jgi:hypothetical protein
MSMLYMTQTGCTRAVRGTITLVNVWHHSDNHRASSFRVSAPQTGDGDAAPEMRKLGAFAFQGRCFVVVRREGSRRPEDGQRGRSPLVVTCTPVALRGVRWFESSGHHKAPSCRQGAATPANGPAWAAPGQTASQTRRNGTGQLPACDLAGWLKVEAEGCRKGNHGPAHTTYPQGGEAASCLPLMRQGKGGCRVKLTQC